ncbi:hypothetical protein AQUSIP_17810 [Aquicella siphonis]|uniref:Transport permease protein n=1 Tax=Aquicella siphonis TaxID=254247 RepID=A0A5E4PJ33_9COXI|nr:ABC transporter permease [Aquicella siphonis]VVC76468.1 hypothetical protein AQUSIP_17810 [Aquicella siphonis]
MSTNEAAINSSPGMTVSEGNAGTVVFPRVSQRQMAWQDIRDGVLNWRIWLLLAYQDIKLRYRRSVLGPFWITLSMAITVYSMGYLYSHLFHMNINEYFPYLVAGMLGWSLVSTTVTDTVETFTTNDSMLKQIKLPYSLYVHRIVSKNLIIFFHNILVIVPVMIIFHDQVSLGWNSLLLFPGLLIIYFNSICYGLVFAMVGGRYRDISQLIKSLIQVVFFVTPIMWKPSILPPSKQFIAYLNPVFSFIELIRAPLIGYPLTLTNILMVVFMTLIGVAACYFIFVSRRARIIYWL